MADVETSHREIYECLVAVETKVDRIEWHEIEALEDGTVFVNVFAEGKN